MLADTVVAWRLELVVQPGAILYLLGLEKLLSLGWWCYICGDRGNC